MCKCMNCFICQNNDDFIVTEYCKCKKFYYHTECFERCYDHKFNNCLVCFDDIVYQLNINVSLFWKLTITVFL